MIVEPPPDDPGEHDRDAGETDDKDADAGDAYDHATGDPTLRSLHAQLEYLLSAQR